MSTFSHETAAGVIEDVWSAACWNLSRGIVRLGDLTTRLGDQTAGPGIVTGDREQAWGEGCEFARGQLGLSAGRTSTNV